MTAQGNIYGINGPIIYLKGDSGFQMNEMVYVGTGRLVGEVIGLTSEPVSYTHLDVYKRQTRMNAKDPKEAVVDAFKTAFSHEQVSPAEDIFGLSQFSSASVSSDAEAGLTLSLDSSSMEELNALTGGGLRISSRNDVSNKKSDANMGIVYNGMDVVNPVSYTHLSTDAAGFEEPAFFFALPI